MPQVLQRRLTTGQAHANFPQRLQLRGLTKQQRHELPLASKPLGIPFCGVPLDRPSELPARKQLQELRKHARYLSHG